MKKIPAGIQLRILIGLTIFLACFQADQDKFDAGLRLSSDSNLKLLTARPQAKNEIAADEKITLFHTFSPVADIDSSENCTGKSPVSFFISAGKISKFEFEGLEKSLKKMVSLSFQRDQNQQPILIDNEYLLFQNNCLDSLIKNLSEKAFQTNFKNIYWEMPVISKNSANRDSNKNETHTNEFNWANSARLIQENQLAASSNLMIFYQNRQSTSDSGAKKYYAASHSLFQCVEKNLISDFTNPLNHSECVGIVGFLNQNFLKQNSETLPSVRPNSFEYSWLEASYFKNLALRSGKSLTFGFRQPFHFYESNQLNQTALNPVIAALLQNEVTGYWFSAPGNESEIRPDPANKNDLALTAILSNIVQQIGEISPFSLVRVSGTQQIGIVVSNSILFSTQEKSVSPLTTIYFPALSLLRAGMPIELVSLERFSTKEYLNAYRILFLSYSEQIPWDSQFHVALKEWIKSGGVLVFYGSSQNIAADQGLWWRTGIKYASPEAHLFELLKIPQPMVNTPQKFGKGALIFDPILPEDWAETDLQKLSPRFIDHINSAVQHINDENYFYKEQNYFYLSRGPFVMASVVHASINQNSLEIPGIYVDCLDPNLPIVEQKYLQPGESAVLYNLKAVKEIAARVLVSASSICSEQLNDREFSFKSRGPAGIKSQTIIKLPFMPRTISLTTFENLQLKYEIQWYPREQVLRLTYENPGEEINVVLTR